MPDLHLIIARGDRIQGGAMSNLTGSVFRVLARCEAAGVLRLRVVHPFRVFFDQAFILLERRKLLKAVRRRRSCPGELFARVRFDERDEAARIIQHGRPKVHEIKAIGPSEHPAHAVRAEKVAGCTVQATNDGLSFCNC
jgi:hypothetical protein